MLREISIFLLTVILAFNSCVHVANINKPANSPNISHQDILFVAGNYDTVFNCKILLTKDNRFVYNISDEDSIPEKRVSYIGSFKYSSDTIFLHYNNNVQPAELEKYLIVEASQTFLIQYFSDNHKRVFLKIQKPIPDF